MSVSGTRAAALVAIEREIARCAEDARRARGQLIAVTSFDAPESLAGLRELEVSEAQASLMLCAARMRDLLAERRRIASA